jgi:acetolactate synthase-1/2/3 large subunit
MASPISRRHLLKLGVAQALVPLAAQAGQVAALADAGHEPGWIVGKMTGAQALVEALIQEGTDCVFGIPGAQENELWDTMKSKGLPYLLVTHEFSAACMADGAARATGKPGVICVVPGPGLTNSLSGIGEALLDSVPMICIVGDVARGDKYKPFQVHELPQVGLLQQVTKQVFPVSCVEQIPDAVYQAFQCALSGEPGPVGVVIPYTMLIDSCKFNTPPAGPPSLIFDDHAFETALGLLADRKIKWGIYAGLGCMDHSDALVHVAEMLQAPVATSVSGKGVISDCHPLAVGWGYGPQGTRTAENVFKHVDGVLAIGVRYSEVSTAFYSIPEHKYLIQVDANPHNLGQIVKPTVCVPADAGLFLDHLIAHQDVLERPTDGHLIAEIRHWRAVDCQENSKVYGGKCGVDPMLFLLALRKATCPDALTFVDVTQAEHWAAEAYCVYGPRTYFNPTDNQAMGWSIAAALGAQRVMPCRQVVTVTGDGCFLMSAMEISTAAREGLPVKFFILDDQAYHYMQSLQKPAYLRTTATILARLDYAALAQGFGVAYQEITCNEGVEAGVRGALCTPGPVLVRVVTDYGKRPCRWIDAVRQKYLKELCFEQKVRFLARIGSRALDHCPQND